MTNFNGLPINGLPFEGGASADAAVPPQQESLKALTELAGDVAQFHGNLTNGNPSSLMSPHTRFVASRTLPRAIVRDYCDLPTLDEQFSPGDSKGLARSDIGHVEVVHYPDPGDAPLGSDGLPVVAEISVVRQSHNYSGGGRVTVGIEQSEGGHLIPDMSTLELRPTDPFDTPPSWRSFMPEPTADDLAARLGNTAAALERAKRAENGPDPLVEGLEAMLGADQLRPLRDKDIKTLAGLVRSSIRSGVRDY